MANATRGREVHRAITSSNQKKDKEQGIEEDDTMEIETPRAAQAKRGQGEKSSRKNCKRPRSVSRGLTPIPNDFWLGFLALEKLYNERGSSLASTCAIMGSVADEVKEGFIQIEAEEVHLVEIVAFTHVPLLSPISRSDGKEGQHYNLTQLPMEEETNAVTRLSSNYQVVVFFQRPIINYKHAEILEKTRQRLKDMEISLEIGIVEPIYIPCKEKVKNGKEKF